MIKKVKGRSYGYEQESYREGGTVRTRTTAYYGPLEPAILRQINQTRQSIGRLKIAQIREIAGAPKPNVPKNKAAPEKVITTDKANRPFRDSLLLPKNMSEYDLSKTAFQRTHLRFGNRLKALGINPSHMPDVKIKYGHPSGFSKDRNGRYVVTVSRKPKARMPINRKELWTNYRLALAQSFLDGLEKGDGVHFNAIRASLDDSYQETKRLTILAANTMPSSYGRLMLSLQILIQNHMPAIGLQQTGKTDAGFYRQGQLKGWRPEASVMIADVQRLGWSALQEKNTKTRKRLKRIIKMRIKAWKRASLLDGLSGRKRKLIREVMEAETQLRALNQLERRQKTLAEIL